MDSNRVRPPILPGVPLVTGAQLPLGFVTVGLCALGGGVGWLALRPTLLLLPHLHPHVVALAHLWLPGFLLSASLGAMYQLMPVVLGAPLRGGGPLAWIHLGLHVVGLALLIAGFCVGRFELAAIGGGFISLGVLLLAQSVLRTFASARRRDAVAWSFPLAAGWLVATVLAGVAIAMHRRWPYLAASPLALLQAHAHLGLAGFFLTLLQGATFQLVPMFTMGELRRPRFAAAGLAFAQTGLSLLVSGLASQWRCISVGGTVLIILGIALSGLALAATLQTRRRRPLEPGVQGFLVGNALLAVAVLGGAGLLAAPEGMISLRGGSAYGVIAIAGGLGLSVLGMLCKIVPFLVWMRTYGPRVGREPVPSATALSSRALERIWLALHVAALPLLTGAITTESSRLAAGGAWFLALGIAVFLWNAIRVLTHLWKPETSRAAPRLSAPVTP